MDINQDSMAIIPVSVETPMGEADAIQSYAASGRLTFTAEFSSLEGEVRIYLGHDAERLVPDDQARIIKLTAAILDAEFGDWRAAPGITGQLIIDREGFFLRGDDLREDWSFERGFDIDDLEFQDWVLGADQPDSESPVPGI